MVHFIVRSSKRRVAVGKERALTRSCVRVKGRSDEPSVVCG